MKAQLIILSLIVSTLALPVPDEEVSPIKPAPIGEIKTDIADETLIKQPLIDAATEALHEKLPALKIEEEKQPLKSTAEDKKILLSTPDAELALALPEQKPELKEKEKNIRAENQAAEETKTLPAGIAETPIVPSAVEEQKQIVEESKPSVQDVQLEGKSNELSVAPAAVSQEKEIAPAATEIQPAVDVASLADTIPEEASELKKEDLSARKERGNEDKVESTVQADHVQVVAEVPAVAPVINAAETPVVKSLLPEEQTEEKVEDKAELAVAATELKSATLAEKTVEEPKPASAGDIVQQLSSEESIAKTLPAEVQQPLDAAIVAEGPINDAAATTLPEAKKIEESATLATAAVLPEEQPQQQIKEQILAAEEKPLKKILDDSSEEKKVSAESKESAESNENKSKSDEI